jgi:hypothetical protein
MVDAGPASVVVADVNGDGKLDIITANLVGNSVSVLPGNGDGTFKTVQNSPFGVDSQPRSVAVADVNGDGVPDIVTANYGGSSGGSVSVLSGNGNGTFRLPRFFDEGSSPVSVLVADVNGGGKPDIITDYEVFNPQSTNILLRQGVRALFGNGDGSFTRSTTIFETTFITSLSAFLSQFSPGVLSPSFNDVVALLSGLSLPGSQSFLTVAAVPGVTSMSATTMPVLMSSPAPPTEPGSRGVFDRLPPDPGAQPERLDLPTERDILAGMDVAGSLLRRTRPQANLVPQPGDVGAVSEFVPGTPDDGAGRKRLADGAEGQEKIDVTPYLISPVEDTLLGPPPTPKAVPPPGLTWAYSLAFEALWQRWQDEDVAQVREDLVLALVLVGGFLLERRSPEERKPGPKR